MNEMDASTALTYFSLLLSLWLLHATWRWSREHAHRFVKAQAIEEGLTEPASLHPVIDPYACIGCQSCLSACPEQGENHVLGLINGKAELINAGDCIGHGACRASCPADAITLVFGSETRGVELPHLQPNFETNVPGVFIAGELGGMGLIRNAIEQGKQVVEEVSRRPREPGSQMLDLVIVGAGPAGFSASLAALERRLDVVTIEQDSLGGAIGHYPRGKIAMLKVAELPTFGKLKLATATKERLLQLFADVERQAGLRVHYRERMVDLVPVGEGFAVRTDRQTYHTRNVLLAVGRRGTPRKLGVPGEELSKVVYRLVDPEQYRNQDVLVVGGGDSAVEAAVAIAAQEGARVSLANRSGSFGRAKAKNRRDLKSMQAAGRVRVLLEAEVKEIGPTHVEVHEAGSCLRLANDAVVVCAGGELPTRLLRNIGIELETKYGTA